ncbi:metallophosphoesterase [Patescibacteria group bacterium]|nr:metallophosphoesterase [Patescibacteria group bacterium]
MKHTFYKKAVLVIFVFVLSAGFVLPQDIAQQANAMIMIDSYIRDLSISDTAISYNQERDGYVCIKAYPYILDYIDPEYPNDPPYDFVDYSRQTDIYSGSMETTGLKNVFWQGRDQNGNVVGPGLYMFEVLIHAGPGCGWPWISQIPEEKKFEITSPPPQNWSFAIISDLHVGQPALDYGNPTWNDGVSGYNISSVKNLKNTIKIINSNIQKYNLKFAVVTGDFTDSAELSELNKAKEILNELNIPWIPLIGNHDIWPYYGMNPNPINREGEMAPEVSNGNGTDKYFYDLFGAQYEKLKDVLQNWIKEDAPVWNPETDPNHNVYFQNFAFDYNGYHFIGLDFNHREIEHWPAKGAAAEGNLHNFSDGTWQWFLNHMQQYLIAHPENHENIILFAHHPFRKHYWQEFYDFKFYNVGFSDEELKTIDKSLAFYREKIYALFAGHTHKNRADSFFNDTLQIIETAANVDGPLARLVQFYPDGRIDYSKMLGNDMRITAHSPIDLEVIDPDGLLINKSTNEITGANYFEENIDDDGDSEDIIEVDERKQGDYQIRVIPEPSAAPDSTYSLDVSVLEDNFGYTPIILAQDVPISQIPVEPYSFQAKERIATNLSYNGGLSIQYSDLVNLSATLTDANGSPIANKDIVFKIGEQSAPATTDTNGIASASLVLSQIPGKYYLVEVNFVGDVDYLPSADIKDFEILKEDTVISVSEKDGFTFDKIILEAGIKDSDGQNLLQKADVEFKIDGRGLGIAQIGEAGVVSSSWQVDLIPKEITENYLIEVIFSGNDYYQLSRGQTNFILKSAKWLKQNAILELEKAKAGDKKIDRKIDQIIKHIQNSLNNNLWIDASHLVFFKKDFLDPTILKFDSDKINLEGLLEFESDQMEPRMQDIFKGKCFEPKFGIRVFYEEHIATKLMLKETVFIQVLEKLVKADTLLAKVSIRDAKNISIQNPKFQKIVEKQIEKAEKEMEKANKELEKGKSDKAIMRFAKAWLRVQLALKFADLEK